MPNNFPRLLRVALRKYILVITLTHFQTRQQYLYKTNPRYVTTEGHFLGSSSFRARF
jgi:hypothetical protein